VTAVVVPVGVASLAGTAFVTAVVTKSIRNILATTETNRWLLLICFSPLRFGATLSVVLQKLVEDRKLLGKEIYYPATPNISSMILTHFSGRLSR
jgi:hypothetical protein